jgi:hypothetical protein
MPKSIRQLQDELLGGDFFKNLSANKSDYDQIDKLPITKQLVIVTAGEFIIQVKENLNKLGKVSTGALQDDIGQGEIEETEMGFKLTVGYDKTGAGKYYDFVNKGVKGYVSKQPDSPYKFNDYRTKNGAPLIGKKFNNAILQWLKDNSIRARAEDQTKKLSKLQKKRKAVTKIVSETSNMKSLAYAIAVGIKEKGLPKTSFFDSAVDKYFGQSFIKVLAQTAGADVSVYLKTFNNRINKK